MQSSPLRVYYIAVRNDLDRALTCAAATAFLDMPILDHEKMIRSRSGDGAHVRSGVRLPAGLSLYVLRCGTQGDQGVLAHQP